MRPTTGKVRKAIFDILGQRCDGDHVLDLYAGTGALGLEAAQRGATRVVFVEQAALSRQTLEENLRRASPSCPTELLFSDAVAGIETLARRGDVFDIVLADPPYDQGEVQRVLDALDEFPLLAPDGVVVVEHSPRERGADTLGQLRRTDERRYGQTHVSFFVTDLAVDFVGDFVGDGTRPHDDMKRR